MPDTLEEKYAEIEDSLGDAISFAIVEETSALCPGKAKTEIIANVLSQMLSYYQENEETP